MRKLARAIIVMLGMAFRADPLRASTVFFLQIVTALGLALSAYWIKLLTDSAMTGNLRGVVVAAAGSGLFGGVILVSAWGGFTIQMVLEERTSHLVDQRIIALSAGIPGIEHHERPDYLDELSLLHSQRGSLSGAVGALVNNAGLVVRVGTTGILLASVHPLLLLLPAFGLPLLFIGAKAVALYNKAQEETAEQSRLAGHLFGLATSAGPAKEVRIFGLGRELVSRHTRVWDAVDRELIKASRRGALLYAVGWFVFAIGFVGALIFVVDRAVTLRPGPGGVLVALATPGDVLMTLTLAAQINELVQQAVFMVNWLFRTLKVAGRYLWLVDYAAGARRVVTDPAAVPDRILKGIDIRGLVFRYPGTETNVLNDVDLHFPAGSTVAIVGENGAGKTTLVKLLSGFYEPTDGGIEVDGVDLSRFSVEEWRRRTSGGFQDFARFEFLARETVGVGDLPRLDEVPAVEAALVRANASDVPDGLPRGLETQLGKSFEDGVELSTGQWQKLALGRAMMREAPLLLILDEPTASLDAQTEHALFERYAGAARRVGSLMGAITILVSHRFSTVRMADMIVVLDEGRVTEVGSHDNLIRNGALYAELYEMQARAYR